MRVSAFPYIKTILRIKGGCGVPTVRFTQERLSFGRGAEAANDGLGIAMEVRPYIDEDIDPGRLVAPFDLSITRGMKQGKAYRPPSANLASIRTFRHWIVGTALLSKSPSTPAAA